MTAPTKASEVEKPKLDHEPTAAELHPEGRFLYYEGDKVVTFLLAMKRLNLDVTIAVQVPADLLDEVTDAWPMGS